MRALAILLLCFAFSGAVRADEQAKGWLGATVEDLSAEEAAKTHGVKVTGLDAGGPAGKAGIETGDIILSLDRVEVEDKAGFEADLAAKAPGAEIMLSVRRGASEKRLAVTLGARPVEQARAAAEERPVLQLDTGGHMAIIKGIAFTPDGRQLVSASEDKTIRVWDLASGKTVRTIRGESAAGPAGKVYAMALSPDGKWLAAGGWLTSPDVQGSVIRLYEFASGKLVALLKGHKSEVLGLAFSPDGSKLISGSGDSTAIIWDIPAPPRKLVPKLLYWLEEHKDFIYAVGFSPDGSRAVTGSYDHDLRLWRVADGKEIAHMTGHGDMVFSLAVAPDGTIASGDKSGEIRLWDSGSGAGASGRDGRFLRILARQGMEVASLSFSPDGKLLLSGPGEGPGGNDCHVYDVASGKEIVTYAGHDNVVIATAFSPDGRWAATGGGNNKEIHLWDPHSGQPRPGPDGKPLRLAGQGQTVWAAGFSADRRRIAWGNSGGWHNPMDRGPLEQALTLPLGEGALGAPVALAEAEAGAFRRAQASFGGFSLSHRKGGAYGHDAILDILKDGRAVASIARDATNGLGHWSYSFTPDGETVVSGGSFGVITAYDRAGNKLGDFVGHEGDVWAVAPSPDGRFLVSSADDQTVRLWNLKTRELLVTLYRGADGEWVLWTPQGYYTGSPGAGEIVGWQINRGPDKAADYATAGQLRQRLHRPDIVAKAIALASAEEAVRTSYGTDFTLSDLLGHPAPQLRILSPAPGSTVKAASAKVKIALDATPDPVERIRIQVNSRNIGEFFGYGPGEHELDVPLDRGKNTIVITAKNQTGWSKLQEGTLTLVNDAPGETVKKRGTLYILAAGVSKYPGIRTRCKPDPNCDLNFTGKDAVAFADIVEARLGPLHERVVRRVLVNEGKSDGVPDRVNIENELGSIWNNATDEDTVAIFLSGHGVNERGNFYFLPTDAASAEGSFRSSSVVSWRIVAEKLDATRGRRLVFLDSCHAEGGYNALLGDEAFYANILAYSAAKSDQRSWESRKYGHGIFTQAILDGLAGAADLNRDGHVDTEELDAYLKKRVPELAAQLEQKPRQDPQFFKARDAETYTLAAFK